MYTGENRERDESTHARRGLNTKAEREKGEERRGEENQIQTGETHGFQRREGDREWGVKGARRPHLGMNGPRDSQEDVKLEITGTLAEATATATATTKAPSPPSPPSTATPPNGLQSGTNLHHTRQTIHSQDHFTSLQVASLRFTSLRFTSLHLHFASLHCTALHFTSPYP